MVVAALIQEVERGCWMMEAADAMAGWMGGVVRTETQSQAGAQDEADVAEGVWVHVDAEGTED